MGGVAPLTEEQKQQVIAAYEAAGHNKQMAAKSLGLPITTFKNRLNRAIKHSSVAHLEPFIPEGQKLRGVSTLYNGAGVSVMQWVKTNADLEKQLELMREITDSLKQEIKPLPPTTNKPTCKDDLMACYVISDYHLGAFAHKEEGGDDWDLEIAQKKLNNWVDMSVSLTPEADTAVLLQLGDFLHTDGLDAVTPKSKHPLDTCARFQKIASVAVSCLRRAITRMLEKHRHVHLIIADANHDPVSSLWLRLMFKTLYENEPRVSVDVTEHPYYCFEWGLTSIFAHHGDKRNLSQVSKVFTGLYREVFGRTKFSYGHIGHFHHSAASEDNLMHVQIHPTMTARDSYAARYGYLSQRKARTIIYSKKYGEVGGIAITPEMI